MKEYYNISATLIKDYLSCRRKLLYRDSKEEYGIKTEDAIAGTIIHKVLENCFEKSEKATLKEIMEEYDQFGYNDSEYESIQTKAKLSINNFYRNFYPILYKDDIIEKRFSISLGTPSDAGIKFNLVGKIDRITKDGVLLDWKTSWKVPESIDNDVQFLIYYHAYWKLYGKYPKKVLFASLTNGKFVEFKYNPIYYNALFNNVIPTLMFDWISGNISVRDGMFKGECKNCDYHVSCWSDVL